MAAEKAPTAKERAAETIRNATPKEMENIKKHIQEVKSNPDKYAKDPDYHASRMKNDLEYKTNQAKKAYVNKLEAEIKKQGTQANHSVTSRENFTRGVGGGISGIGLGGGAAHEQMR